MKLELLSSGLTILGWLAILIWIINFLFTHHDHIKQSIFMILVGWFGLVLILVGGGVNYLSNQQQSPNDNAPQVSNVKTHESGSNK
ncbi:hypothetical protein JOC36_000763 [Weissella uvarum]|uniref:hypothetical protein n=1 Tax=Weissella uvarum TaxID=1479233 RepID=UPI00195FFF3F|nr:hypothetical protein [Weissella uvarum]MBM7617214.1 hypothetical protein [Weissella uvarum]MCM0595507.1 hypothetical protein [Weissella uvarum]